MGSVSFTTFSVLTGVLLILTVCVGVSRFTRSIESNWPLVYYLLVVAHWKVFDGGLNPYWVYVGVVSGLFLRFEFMGGIILKSVWGVELAALAYIAWRSVGMMMGW